MQVINTVGRRKTAVARVYMKPGTGDVKVNGRELSNYFLPKYFRLFSIRHLIQ